MEGYEQAKKWAKQKALTEAEAFEYAIRSANIRKTDFEIDDKYKQAYRQGRIDQARDNMAEIKALQNKIQEQNDRINRLTETIQRRSDNEWD